MTRESRDEYRRRAEAARAAENVEEAGRLYTLACYESLGACDYDEPAEITSGAPLGLGVYCLQQAAIACRVAGNDRRSRNRARQGVLIAEEHRDDVFVDPALEGLAEEWIGDFRTIAAESDADAAYERALDRYDSVDGAGGWLAEPIFEWSLESFFDVADAAGRPVSVERQADMRVSFADRVEWKRALFGDVLNEVTGRDSYSPRE